MSKNNSHLTCYRCGAVGHVGMDCTSQLNTAASSSSASSGQPTTETLEGGSTFTELYGDLMSSPDSLCHCVSECLAMGAGIAVLFKQGFGRVDELKAQEAKVGGVAVLDVTPQQANRTPNHDDDELSEVSTSTTAPRRFAYYLITKPRYFHKPTYDTLAASLTAMFNHMAANGVSRIAMPELGCGLDGLEWPRVRSMVMSMLKGRGIHVTVYHFKPAVRLSGRSGNFASKK